MRGTPPSPQHRPIVRWPAERADVMGERRSGDPDEFRNRACYEFNRRLPSRSDDRHCHHCRHYLTSRCPSLEEFLDEVDDLSPE